MKLSQWNWITDMYQNATDYILFFSKDWKPLWQNKECPFLPEPENFRERYGISKTVEVPMQLLIPFHDTLHFVQIDLCPKDADTAAKRKAVYLVRINKAPLEKALWENKDFSHTIDNTHAELRNEIFGTANAARGIFSLLMNNEPPISKVTKKDLALQLNVIDGNCRKEMQHIAYTSEIRRFRQNEDITPTPIFLKRFLSYFEDGCLDV